MHRVIGFDDATPKYDENEYEVRYWRLLENIEHGHPFIVSSSTVDY
jgi:hypothetical protein